MVLMTVHGPKGAPTLAEAAAELGVPEADIDRTFGVVSINPADGLYAVDVKASSVATSRGGGDYNGPYSNPQIAPFGPVQSGDKPDDER